MLREWNVCMQTVVVEGVLGVEKVDVSGYVGIESFVSAHFFPVISVCLVMLQRTGSCCSTGPFVPISRSFVYTDNRASI
jgi:hypothetical protein